MLTKEVDATNTVNFSQNEPKNPQKSKPAAYALCIVYQKTTTGWRKQADVPDERWPYQAVGSGNHA
ncbi:MAG: hypothetical protein ACLFUB_05285 [Cyclobacteriaceae bacterium]